MVESGSSRTCRWNFPPFCRHRRILLSEQHVYQRFGGAELASKDHPTVGCQVSVPEDDQMDELLRVVEASFCVREKETIEGSAWIINGHPSWDTMFSNQFLASLKRGDLCS